MGGKAVAGKAAGAGAADGGAGGLRAQRRHGMRAWVLALVAAAPLEMILSFRYAYPVDGGFDPGTSWLKERMSDVWLVVHWPSLAALHWMERWNWGAGSELFVFFGIGYVDVALLLLAAILAWRWLWRRLAASPPRQDGVGPDAH